MQIELTAGIFGGFEVPDSNLVGCFGPAVIQKAGLSDIDIRERIHATFVRLPFREVAKNKKNVLIVTDDNTRRTPLKRILPIIVEELEQAGMEDEQITFLIGLGTHRAMTQQEIVAKFGSDISRRFQIINHEWDNPDALVSLGICELGFEVVINRLATETEMVIAIGSIVPHATTGFSGGGKSIMPGICGEKTIEDTHWKALNFEMSDILGKFDNPVRQAVVSVSRKINLAAIVNTVLFEEDKIYDLVVGDVITAHQQGINSSLEVYGTSIPEKADIVVAEAFPTDIDLRQAIKAICSADIVINDGGLIILIAECPDGVAPQFPEFASIGFSDPDRLFEDVESGRIKNKLMAYTLVAIGRIISKRVRAILVSSGIKPSKARKMGFQWAPNVESAMDKAFNQVGRRSRVIILKQAGQILPLINS